MIYCFSTQTYFTNDQDPQFPLELFILSSILKLFFQENHTFDEDIFKELYTGHRPKIQKQTKMIAYLKKWWKDQQRLSTISSYQLLYQEIYPSFGTIFLKIQVSQRVWSTCRGILAKMNQFVSSLGYYNCMCILHYIPSRELYYSSFYLRECIMKRNWKDQLRSALRY